MAPDVPRWVRAQRGARRRSDVGAVAKSVVACGAVVLATAGLALGASSRVLEASSAPMSLRAGSGFAITSNTYPWPACSGATPRLFPGVRECVVFTVTNHLSVPITVQSLTMAVTSAPAGCPTGDFALPTYSGNLHVGRGGTASTSGLPISLLDTGTDQDACEGSTVSFAYRGNAAYTDGTSTTLTASPTSPSSGQVVTLGATVKGANAASDPSPPTGTVTFNSCPTSACSSSTALGTGAVGSTGVATLTTTDLGTGVHYLQAVYGGDGTDYAASTSSVLALTVGAPVTAAATAGAGVGSSGARTTATSGAIAFTGAEVAGMVVVALILVVAGAVVVVSVRRRRPTAEREP